MSEPLSPLSTTSPDALTNIFESDPLTLTDAQLLTLVTELRRRRNAFLSEEAAKATKPKGVKPKLDSLTSSRAAALDKPPSEISLDDI